MKFFYFVFIIVSLSSCFSQRSITLSHEPISNSILEEMRHGKVYRFYFKNEYIYKVKIESTADSTITGKTKSVHHEHIWIGEVATVDKFMDAEEKKPFVYGYSEIREKTNKITTRKVNPVLTSLGMAGLLTLSIAIINLDPL